MPDKTQMLDHLASACSVCGMCELGWSKAKQGGHERDPHVFGWRDHMIAIPDVMVVGQNPGWNEVCEGIPFVGAAGRAFEQTLDKYGAAFRLERSRFYITNTVKCFARDNATPTPLHMGRCEPFLQMEIAIVKPRFIVTLGSVAFAALCPGINYADALGKFTLSEKFGVRVFAIYHPSPRNLSNRDRMAKFEHDMKLLCGVLGRLETPF